MSADLELRRKALLASGCHEKPCTDGPDWIVDDKGHWGPASRFPAIESEPQFSEPWFLEWCEKEYWLWQLEESPIGEYAIHLRAKANKPAPHWNAIDESGATPSLARAKAVIQASLKSVGVEIPE